MKNLEQLEKHSVSNSAMMSPNNTTSHSIELRRLDSSFKINATNCSGNIASTCLKTSNRNISFMISMIGVTLCTLICLAIITVAILFFVCFFLNWKKDWFARSRNILSLVVVDFLFGVSCLLLIIISSIKGVNFYMCILSNVFCLSGQVAVTLNILRLCVTRMVVIRNKLPERVSAKNVLLQSLLVYFLALAIYIIPVIMWADRGPLYKRCVWSDIFPNNLDYLNAYMFAVLAGPTLLTNVMYMLLCVYLKRSYSSVTPVVTMDTTQGSPSPQLRNYENKVTLRQNNLKNSIIHKKFRSKTKGGVKIDGESVAEKSMPPSVSGRQSDCNSRMKQMKGKTAHRLPSLIVPMVVNTSTNMTVPPTVISNDPGTSSIPSPLELASGPYEPPNVLSSAPTPPVVLSSSPTPSAMLSSALTPPAVFSSPPSSLIMTSSAPTPPAIRSNSSTPTLATSAAPSSSPAEPAIQALARALIPSAIVSGTLTPLAVSTTTHKPPTISTISHARSAMSSKAPTPTSMDSEKSILPKPASHPQETPSIDLSTPKPPDTTLNMPIPLITVTSSSMPHASSSVTSLQLATISNTCVSLSTFTSTSSMLFPMSSHSSMHLTATSSSPFPPSVTSNSPTPSLVNKNALAKRRERFAAVIKMIGIIILFVDISVFPYITILTLRLTSQSFKPDPQIYMLLTFFLLVNCIADPIIYILRMKELKSAFWKLLIKVKDMCMCR